MNHYQILNIDINAPLAAIKKAYRALAMQYHPDKNYGLDPIEKQRKEELYKQVQAAYDELSDPAKRRLYNLELKGARHPELAKILNPFPVEWKEEIFKNTELRDFCEHLRTKYLFNADPIRAHHFFQNHLGSILQLYRQMPDIFSLLNDSMARMSPVVIGDCLVNAKGDPNKFAQSFLGALISNGQWDKVDEFLKKQSPQQSAALLAGIGDGMRGRLGANPVFNTHYLNFVWGIALRHKAGEVGGNVEVAKKQLEEQMISAYYSGNFNELPEAGGIKALFSEGVFRLPMLSSFFPPVYLKVGAIAHFIKETTPSPQWTQYIKDLNVTSIDREFVDLYFTESRCNNPRALFEGIQKISHFNPNLANVLFAHAIQKINSSAPGAFEKFQDAVFREDFNPFKNWLLMQNPIPQQYQRAREQIVTASRALDVFTKFVNNDLDIDFNSIGDNKKLMAHKLGVLNALDEIVKDPSMAGAREVFGSRMQQIVDHKKIQIEQAANKREKVLNEANQALAQGIRKINDLKVDFNAAITPAGILREERKLKENLNALVNSPDLVAAKQVLHLQNPPELIQAVDRKMKEISEAARQAPEQLKIKELLSGFDSFPISYSGLTSDRIELRQRIQIQQVNKIKNEALHKGVPPAQVHSRFEEACKLINEGALQAHDQLRREAIQKQKAEMLAKERAEVEGILEKNGFPARLEALRVKVVKLEGEANKAKYGKAAGEARELYEGLVYARDDLLNSASPKARMARFDEQCSGAIEKALPFLQEHRGWRHTLRSLWESIKNCFSSSQQMPADRVVSQPKAPGRWDTPTRSAEIVNDIKKALKEIKKENQQEAVENNLPKMGPS